jgi:hypothetical protein
MDANELGKGDNRGLIGIGKGEIYYSDFIGDSDVGGEY